MCKETVKRICLESLNSIEMEVASPKLRIINKVIDLEISQHRKFPHSLALRRDYPILFSKHCLYTENKNKEREMLNFAQVRRLIHTYIVEPYDLVGV